VELSGPAGTEFGTILSQTKRTALLAFLAVATPRGFHRRDKIAGLFWTDSDHEHARASLRNAVYFLRRHLSDDAIISRGDEELSLDWERVWCDAAAFEEALERGDGLAALELYRGELLEGLFLSGCPEFERWLDGERERLKERAAGAAWSLAHRRIEEGSLTEAERTGQRGMDLVPTDENEVRRFIRALAEAGDRAAAVRFYQKFVGLLEEELELEPSEETRAVAEDIRAGGSPEARGRPERNTTSGRGPQTEGRSAPAAAVAEEGIPGLGERTLAPATPAPRREPRRWPGRALWGLGAAIALSIVFLGIRMMGPGTETGIDPRVVVVMPFENLTGDAELDYVGQMASATLTYSLARTGLVHVKNFETAFLSNHYLRSRSEDGGDADPWSGFAVEAGAGTVIHGTYALIDGDLRIDAAFTDVASGTLLRAVEPVRGGVESPMEAVEALQPRVLGGLAMEFDPGLTPYADQVFHSPTDGAAREFARGARLYLVDQEYEAAMASFLRTHELDPTFYSALVMGYWAGINDETAGGVARLDSIRSILTEHQADLTPYERAVLEGWRERREGDLDGMIREYEEACTIAPGEKACYNLGRNLYADLNDPRRAIRVLTTRLTPEQGWMRGWRGYWNVLAQAYLVAGDYDLALSTAVKGGELNPEFSTFRNLELRALAALGRIEDGFSILQDTLTPAWRGFGSAASGFGDALFLFEKEAEARRAWERSAEWYRKQIEVDGRLAVRRGLGWQLFKLGRLDEAEALADGAAAAYPDSAGPRADLGLLAAARGDTVEARRTLAWLDTRDDVIPSRRLLWQSRIAEALGSLDEAMAYHQAVWDHPAAYNKNLGWRMGYFPRLRGHPAWEAMYWPAGRGRR
jgi:serine/threonine-protein kinase